jgi:hypothetical protein
VDSSGLELCGPDDTDTFFDATGEALVGPDDDAEDERADFVNDDVSEVTSAAPASGTVSAAHKAAAAVAAEEAHLRKVVAFRAMCRERGITQFSSWDKSLPLIAFDARFTAVPQSERRGVFDHFVRVSSPYLCPLLTLTR